MFCACCSPLYHAKHAALVTAFFAAVLVGVECHLFNRLTAAMQINFAVPFPNFFIQLYCLSKISGVVRAHLRPFVIVHIGTHPAGRRRWGRPSCILCNDKTIGAGQSRRIQRKGALIPAGVTRRPLYPVGFVQAKADPHVTLFNATAAQIALYYPLLPLT